MKRDDWGLGNGGGKDGEWNEIGLMDFICGGFTGCSRWAVWREMNCSVGGRFLTFGNWYREFEMLCGGDEDQ